MKRTRAGVSSSAANWRGLAGEGDDGVAGGCHDFAGLAAIRVVRDCPNATGEDVSDLLKRQVGVDAVGVAWLDVALRQREMGAGGDVDGVDGDAVGGGDGWAGCAGGQRDCRVGREGLSTRRTSAGGIAHLAASPRVQSCRAVPGAGRDAM